MVWESYTIDIPAIFILVMALPAIVAGTLSIIGWRLWVRKLVKDYDLYIKAIVAFTYFVVSIFLILFLFRIIFILL